MDFSELKSKEWRNGDWIYINKLRWGKDEVNNILECLKDDWFGGGSRWNKLFESRFAQFIGAKHFQTTNSGTSAISNAIQVLMQTGRLRRGDKILHPALTFPTSISTAIRYGLIPVFADTEPGTYVISNEAIDTAFDECPEIAGAIIPLLLGNIPDMDYLLKKLNGRPLIVDSCDTVGSKWNGVEVGSMGDIGCYSFYGSHHISTFGVGGGIAVNDDNLYDLLNSLTFWGRDFSTDKGDAVTSFLKRYSYKTVGGDTQLSAIQAAFGVAQLDKLPAYIGQRQIVFSELTKLFSGYVRYFELPRRVSNKSEPSWFCYPLEVKKYSPFTRYDFVKYLTENKVETRPIMAGNLLDHPPYQNIIRYVSDSLVNTNRVSQNGFFLPAYGMEQDEFEEYLRILKGFLGRY